MMAAGPALAPQATSQDVELWAAAAEHTACSSGDALVFRILSHQLEKEHRGPTLDERRQSDGMMAKLAKAIVHPGYQECFIWRWPLRRPTLAPHITR